MNTNTHLTDVQKALAAVRRQQVIAIIVGVLAVLLALKDMTRSERIILEPPTRSKTITITGNRVDGAWLEEMGTYVAHMMLDASPASIGWQQDQVLRWVHPATHGTLQQAMAVQAKRLTEANAATVFWLRQIAPDPANTRVAMLGTLETYINGTKAPNGSREVAYVAEFQANSGRLLLKDWKEVPGDDIWLARLMEQQRVDAERAAKDAGRARTAP